MRRSAAEVASRNPCCEHDRVPDRRDRRCVGEVCHREVFDGHLAPYRYGERVDPLAGSRPAQHLGAEDPAIGAVDGQLHRDGLGAGVVAGAGLGGGR